MGTFSSLISKFTSLLDEELMLVEFLTDKQYKAYTGETSDTKKQLLRIRTEREELIHNSWLTYKYSEKIFFLQHLTYSFNSKLDNIKIPFVLECLDDENIKIQSLGSHLLFLFFCRLVYEKFNDSFVHEFIIGYDDFEFARDFACLWGNYEYIERNTGWEEVVDNFLQNEKANTIIQHIWDVIEFMTVNKDILRNSSIDCLIDFVFEGSLKQILKGFSDHFLEHIALSSYELYPDDNRRIIALCCDILIQRVAYEDLYYDSRLKSQDKIISQLLSTLCSSQGSDIQTDWIEYKNRLEYRDDELVRNNNCVWYDNMYLIPKLVDQRNCDDFFEGDIEDLMNEREDLDYISRIFDNGHNLSSNLNTQLDDEEEILNRLYNDESYVESILDDLEMFENGWFEKDPESWDLD
ncbi:MAG TPA: hypothetical protein PLH64_05510 [Anaerolineaceae bacterium]|nr:hypothetical protein [Anaerolineaceae bacterium]